MNKHPVQLVSVVFRLPRAKLVRLRKLAAASRIRQSEFLREAVSDLLLKHENGGLERRVLCPHGFKLVSDTSWAPECGKCEALEPESKPLPSLAIQQAWERSQLTCGCGRAYTWAEFLALAPPLRGSQQPSEDDDGRPIVIELRQCACHNTMARLPSKCPDGWAP